MKRASSIDEKTMSGRVLDQEAVALLRLAQLALEPLLLGDVADRALDAGEPTVLQDRDEVISAGERRAVAVADSM